MTKYNISGMSCAACSARIEKAVSALDGVDECSVNLLTNSMTVEGKATPDTVIASVCTTGYGAVLDTPQSTYDTKQNSQDENEAHAEARAIILRLILSCVFLGALMYISMGHVMWGAPLPRFFEHNPLAIALSELLLSSVVLIINQRFFISGFKSAIRLSPNMDTLVSLGSGVSFLYSVYLVFMMSASDMQEAHAKLHELYFESAAMILTLITVGKLLESYSKGKTTNALKALIKLAPKYAVLLREGKEIKVPIAELRRGDLFVVKAGESVAADGIVKEGSAAIDESSLTGESIPSDKEVGERVYAATINQSGYLVCEATDIGEDTVLSKIIKAVSDATATKAPIARLADKVSGVFVPVVIAVATLTCAIWLLFGESVGFSLARGISVLVISCPCALGLATPVAIMVGGGKGAENGILFKNATALEEAGRAKIVAVDKTGTLTVGSPQITDVIEFAGTSKETLLQLAYTIEKKSEHPLAKAVVEYAQQKNITAKECTDINILAGNGICARVGESTVVAANMKYIKSMLTLPHEAEAIAEDLSEQGKTPMFFAEGDKLLGIIAVSDKIKDDSREAVAELSRMGISVVMLTGDNERTAKAVADKIGISRVVAGILPNEKEAAVRALKKEGKVLMVGDGINDAPALAAADIGMAIGAGTEIAVDSADIVLLNSSPSDIAAAIKLSEKTLLNIKENLFWAFIYNAIGIPLAAGAFISLLGWELEPMFGAAAMSLSSFCVVTNALRLNLVKLKPPKHCPTQSEQTAQASPLPPTKESESNQTLTLYIDGMMCSHCEKAVTKALEALDGVETAVADHTLGTATLTLSSALDRSVFADAVEAQGYTIKDCK